MKTLNRTILIIDNEICRMRNLKTSLQSSGYKVKTVENGQQAIHYLKTDTVHVLISDFDTGQISGIGLIEETLNIDSSIGIIFIATNSDIKNVVKVMKSGAFDYFDKSFLMEELLFAIEKAIERKELIEENNCLRNKFQESCQYDGIVYESEKMKAIISMIDRIAQSNATVLLMGESGVGKEVFAKMIHNKSMRKDKRFIVINCAAIPENLIESELFGHEKGSFTGASYRKIGKFEQAEGGTVFLDEMAELSLDMQVKFLRVLQERQLERVGSSNSINVDVRIIAATNKDLSKELEKGNFREDLYYRLNVVKIDIPPLRERKEDIGALAKTFLYEFSRDYEKNLKLLDIEAMLILLNHTWKGNVRELKNVIERSVVIAKKNEEILLKKHLPIEISNNKNFIEGRGRTEMTLKEYEKLIIIDTLNKVDGSKSKAAEILDIRRQTLYNKIKEYNISL
ncbi:MAG TPA: sigma-54 dependent transcriptional regulator [Clostridia bacterium]|nr:sigma-54 dependent transcriptional regulator [Clostridia bacterium]